MTTTPNLNWIANYIRGIADDILRDIYDRGNVGWSYFVGQSEGKVKVDSDWV